MKRKNNQISFKDQDIFIGIDTHLKNWKVTIMLEHSEFKTLSMNPSASELAGYVKKNFPGGNYYSAYEASFCGFNIHRELIELGINNIIVNPADVPTTDKERKQKEDKRDSKKIARSLRSRELEGIYIPSIESIDFRSLVRFRKTLVKEISRNKNRVKSLLHFQGIKIPLEMDSESKYWSGKFTQWLYTMEFSTKQGQLILHNLLNITAYLRQNLLAVNRELRKELNSGERSSDLKLLCKIPGIGLIVAVTILSELDDILRFKSFDKLCSFVGLVPQTNSSGDTENVGGITKRANKPLRGVIIEAAWVASRNDPSLALAFNELCKRMKKNEAIVRIAKKLLRRIKYVMKNKQEYVYAVA